MIWLISIACLYVTGGFVYAGVNAMIDLNWAWKLYQNSK